MIDTLPVILCGGSGSRLWPLSRLGFPKQFLCLTGDESLFQLAANRLMALANADVNVAPPLVVCNEAHRFLVSEQLREVGLTLGKALLEPVGKNTAPALTLAALAARAEGHDPVLLATPSDQTLADLTAYRLAMQQAIRAATMGEVVMLGVAPDRAATGYGYIQTQLPASATDDGDAAPPWSPLPQPVLRFVEKPDVATAATYLASGDYCWNAGIFVVKASVWLAAIGRHRPDITQATHNAWLARQDDGVFIRPGSAEFAAIPAESVDYAVLEPMLAPNSPQTNDIKASVVRLPTSVGWSDLGAWDAVWQVNAKDDNGNALLGDVLTHDSQHNLVEATHRLVCLVGVDQLVVVETADAVLVTRQSACQGVKQIVDNLVRQRRPEQVLHRKVHRPWGWYDSIDEGERFKVKRIMVKPKASLSLQKHHHRAEHWIVVKGTAEIRCGDKSLMLSENQSTYIPLGETHRLTNPGTIDLEIIEVQSGSYLGEDDIVRFADDYGRGNS